MIGQFTDIITVLDDMAEKDKIHRKMIGILEREIEIVQAHYKLVEADARIGYEASNHYFYQFRREDTLFKFRRS